jgi:hypothetical protein
MPRIGVLYSLSASSAVENSRKEPNHEQQHHIARRHVAVQEAWPT